LKKPSYGFITIDVLIAGMILTAGIAASMYLFRLGYNYLQKANIANTLSVKIAQAPALVRTLDLSQESGTEDFGDGVVLKWTSNLISKSRPQIMAEFGVQSMHELYLYEVTLDFEYAGVKKTYKINVFRSKALVSPQEIGQ